MHFVENEVNQVIYSLCSLQALQKNCVSSGAFSNALVQSDIQYTYEDPPVHDLSGEQVPHATTDHQNTSPRVPQAVTVSVAPPSGSPSTTTTSYHQTQHDYQQQEGSLVENQNCSPLIKQQNPILNQTIDHLAPHDETTDLNVSYTTLLGHIFLKILLHF